ncbi:50S ribosomal protein L4 [bacterium]|nr:50S ribosomal protein L4 [Candidatus Elulimicrobium humile]
MKIQVVNTKGEVQKQYELPVEIFGLDTNDTLVHQAYRYQVLNNLYPVAHTKDRSEVRGGGKKPWKQKGTGRARHGSTRSPIWRTGGVTFGPTSLRNFAISVNKKMKRKALFMALSARVASDKFVLLNEFALAQMKTKDALLILNNLKLDSTKTLVVFDRKDKNIEKSFSNIPNVSLIPSDSLNLIDILKSDTILTDITSVESIKSIYSN